MSEEEMMELAWRIGQAWTEGKPELLDEAYGPGFINRTNGQDCEATRKALVQYVEAFSDRELTVNEVIVAGDKVVAHGITRGLHTGPYLGIPATGKRIERAFMNIFRIENGKVIEEWSLGDDLGMLRQVGVLK